MARYRVPISNQEQHAGHLAETMVGLSNPSPFSFALPVQGPRAIAPGPPEAVKQGRTL